MDDTSSMSELWASPYSEVLSSEIFGVMMPSVIAGLFSVRGIDPIDRIERFKSSEILSWERRVGVSGAIVEFRLPPEVTVSSGNWSSRGLTDIKSLVSAEVCSLGAGKGSDLKEVNAGHPDAWDGEISEISDCSINVRQLGFAPCLSLNNFI